MFSSLEILVDRVRDHQFRLARHSTIDNYAKKKKQKEKKEKQAHDRNAPRRIMKSSESRVLHRLLSTPGEEGGGGGGGEGRERRKLIAKKKKKKDKYDV